MSSTRWSPVVPILSLSLVLLASGFAVSAQLFTVQIGEPPPNPPPADDIIAGGPLTHDTTWSGSVLVQSNVTVPGPFTLTVLPGTTIKLTNNVGLAATGGGHIDVQGAEDRLVTFDRVNTSFTRWGDLAATGAGSTLALRHVHTTRGRIRTDNGATTLVEDSELGDMPSTGIVGGNAGALFTIRRCYVHDYSDIDMDNMRAIAEDSLFERANSDIYELQGSPSGSIIRRCTFRECLNPNSDAVDMNGCHDVFIDSCLIYDVTDKGISSGSASRATDPTSFGLVVTNTLIYNANIGIAIKDGGTASLYGNTFADVVNGISAYGKFTTMGGHVTNGFNNLVWQVTTSVHLSNDATVVLAFSDVQHTNYPGSGNISSDPLWQDAVARDYQLRPGSPCLGTGRDGARMGASFPVGAPMAPSHPRIDTFVLRPEGLQIEFWADHTKSTSLQRSEDLSGNSWTTITTLSGLSRPQRVRVTNAPAANTFYRIVAE